MFHKSFSWASLPPQDQWPFILSKSVFVLIFLISLCFLGSVRWVKLAVRELFSASQRFSYCICIVSSVVLGAEWLAGQAWLWLWCVVECHCCHAWMAPPVVLNPNPVDTLSTARPVEMYFQLERMPFHAVTPACRHVTNSRINRRAQRSYSQEFFV